MGVIDIGLATHIDDIVNYILFEDLHDVIAERSTPFELPFTLKDKS